MKTIIAFGNPLLDTVVLIQDDKLLKKYGFQNDDQKEISKEKMASLMEDIITCEKTLSAGGCAQNTLKVMQWLLQKQCVTTIFGAVGDDKEGEILHHILETHGVKTNYVKHKEYHTGLTVALVNESKRSLVACLGAAEVLTMNDLTNTDIITQITYADLVYMEGFFITKRVDVAKFILNYCNVHKKKFAFNISGVYICKEYPDVIEHFLLRSSIIFGNRAEFEAICPFMKCNNVNELLMDFNKKGKIVAMTDGANCVVCASGDGKILNEIPVPQMEQFEILDTTGAGDAFVAGFLVGQLLEKSSIDSSKLGCYAAQEIIKGRGCTVPQYPPVVLM